MLNTAGKIAKELLASSPVLPEPQVVTILKVTIATITVAEALWSLVTGEGDSQ